MIRRLQLWVMQYACDWLLADLSTGGWLTDADRKQAKAYLASAAAIILRARELQQSAQKIAGPEHQVRRATPLNRP